MSEKLYSWEFNDEKNRSQAWYIIALSIVIGLSIWGFLTSQYWMSFLVLLIAWIFYFVENNSENIVKVEINEAWIKTWTSFYDYKSIESFWIVYKWDKSIKIRLNLKTKGIKYLDLNIDNSIVIDIKNILNNFIEETPKIELSFSEKIIQLLKL